MASSYNQKSNSSASRAPKPTYRRAAAAKKTPASRKPSSAPQPAPVSRGAAKPRPVSARSQIARPASAMGVSKAKRPVPTKRGVVPGKSAKASARQRQLPHGTRPVASPAAVRAAEKKTSTAHVSSLTSGKKTAAKIVVPGVKRASMPAAGKPSSKKTGVVRVLRPLMGAFAAIGGFFTALASKLNIRKPSRGVLIAGVGGLAAVALAVVVIANSALFEASDIQVRGSDHVEQQTVQALVDIPEGTTLLNVDEKAILEQLQASPWIKGVQIERSWPHALVITPVERQLKAIAYITADEIAWAIGDDGTWIAPVTLLVAVDAEGNEVEVGEDGSVPEGATLLSSQEAALRVAQDSGALLLTDVPSDISPKSGEPVNSDVVLAGLEYANGFSSEFVAQIKSLSVSSVEAISAYLISGVEVSLGAPDNITEKERVVTKLLSQETGVSFINVREPGAYTFRSAPQ